MLFADKEGRGFSERCEDAAAAAAKDPRPPPARSTADPSAADTAAILRLLCDPAAEFASVAAGAAAHPAACASRHESCLMLLFEFEAPIQVCKQERLPLQLCAACLLRAACSAGFLNNGLIRRLKSAIYLDFAKLN